MKVCPTCKHQYPDTEKFCRKDGNRLIDATSERRAELALVSADGKTKTLVLEKSAISIGASLDNTLVLSDSSVSRHHARIVLRDAEWLVVDNRSTNGVYVNGIRIGAEEFPLRSGDEILIGRTKLSFRIVAHLPSPPITPPVKPPQTPKPVVPNVMPRVERGIEKIEPKIDPRVAAKPESPRILDGRYELGKVISQDALGTLYLAHRLALGDTVAVRLLKPSLVTNSIALERFRRQALVAARIHHPNAVQIFDFVQSPEGNVYIVEELVVGKTLRDVIDGERGLTLPRTVSVFNQICGAVHAAHLNGIVLRDLRPANIYLETTPDGQEIAKIAGTGLAKIEHGAGMTMAGIANVIGAGQYMSPEQWQAKPVDSRADVYSLGVILFEMLTGTVPFDAETRQEIADLHLKGPVPELADRGRSDLDESVNVVVARALEKDPNRRPPTAIHLAAEFEAVAGVKGGFLGNIFQKATGILAVKPVIVPQQPAPVPAGQVIAPAVLAEVKEEGRGAFNPVVVALMAEAFFSRVSGGLLKIAVPLYALLVFGFSPAKTLSLMLVQNVVPLVLRPFFGSMADRYGKKKVFLISLAVRTVVGMLYLAASVPIFYFASIMRGIADSAKSPSASAMIADHTDEGHMARAYSWYTTTKSTSGSIGETLAVWLIPALLAVFIASQMVPIRVAVVPHESRPGATQERIIRDVSELGGVQPLRIEERSLRLYDVPLDDLPKVVNQSALKRTLAIIFILSTIFSALSFILIALFIKEKKKEKSKKKAKEASSDKMKGTGRDEATDVRAPNVWAFALMGTLVTAPAYMVSGEFFVILAVKLGVTAKALATIKILSEMIAPLFFGPFFGWVADRIGSGKVLAFRSISNIVTSVVFWVAATFSGTAWFSILLGSARGLDEIGKAAFKPTWGAVSAKVSSYNLATRGRTMGILEGGVDTSDLIFPQVAGLIFTRVGLSKLMLVRGVLALIAEIYTFMLMRKHKV